MSTDFRTQLTTMLRSGFSGVCINTQEVDRCDSEILEATRAIDWGYKRWTLTQSWLELQEVSTDSGDIKLALRDERGGEGSPGDPVGDALAITTLRNKTVYVMHWADELFREPIQRQVFRDVLGPARASKKMVILLGSFALPPDLEKEFASVEFDLPDRTSLERIAKNLLTATRQPIPPPADLAKVIDGALGLTQLEAQNAYALSLVREQKLDVASIVETKKEIVRKSGILEYIETTESLDTVGGLNELKAWAIQRAEGFTAKAQAFGLAPPKGVLMAGVPGAGKSLVAKAIAVAWGLPLLRLDMGRVFGSLVGQSEAQLRSALKTAEALAPCVLFIDEFEKAVGGSTSSGGDGGTTQRVMGSFLTWMQDRPTDKPVFVVATANNIDALPPEMIRKGRWDEVWAVGLPTADERKVIFEIHLKKVGRDPANFNLEQLANNVTTDFTGAEIEQVVKDGLWKAFAESRELLLNDLVTAARDTLPLARGPMKDMIDRMMTRQEFRKASKKAVATSDERAIEMEN